MHTARQLILGSIIATFALPANAATLSFESFSELLNSDDSISSFDFTVDTSARVGIRTFSYSGGLLADGTDISPGRFDPILSLFDSNNTFISANDDRGPTTGARYDSRIVRDLTPGTYTVAVSQYDKFHNESNGKNILSGFQCQNDPNFTANAFDCSVGQFCDVRNDSRTNRWVTEVPEPSTILGSGLMLGLLGLFRRWKIQHINAH